MDESMSLATRAFMVDEMLHRSSSFITFLFFGYIFSAQQIISTKDRDVI